ncbi:Glutaredoxin-C1 [Diplonema papillatum]|nr:Glutaredoxin-C1 [Diplonema papillatum]
MVAAHEPAYGDENDRENPAEPADNPSLKDAIANSDVVVVAKTTCGFCKRALDVLYSACDPVVFFEDKAGDGAEVRKLAEELTGHKTVPIVWIKGQFVGGCDSIIELQRSGDLYTRIGSRQPPQTVGGWVEPERNVTRPEPIPSGLFWFPHTVNIYPVRAIALQMVAVCVVCIIWREDTWAAWLALGMALDFLVRLCGGAFFSPAGTLGMVLTSFLKEDLRNGPPKQFATFVGLCFSATAGFCLINGEHIPGAVVLGCLAGAASLEAFFDVCLGCIFFGYMVQFNLVRSSVYDVHIDQRPAVRAAIDNADDFTTELKQIEPLKYREIGQPATSADSRIKLNKSDDHVRRAFNPVKYVEISDFMMPLGVAGLAVPWKLGRGTLTYYAPAGLWRSIAYMSLALFSILGLLLMAKLVLHTRKVYKEVIHPVKSNFIAALPMCVCLYAFLLEPDTDSMADFRVTIYLIASVLLKILLVYKAAWLVANRGDEEIITPALLLPIGGCLVGALVAPVFGSGYYEYGWFQFGLSAVLALLLFGSSFVASIQYHWSDERVRGSIGMWATVLHLMFLAYATLRSVSIEAPGVPVVPSAVASADAFERVLFYAGLTLTLVFLWLAVFMGFVFRLKFDFSYWAVSFTADILAAACVLYQQRTETPAGDRRFEQAIGYFAAASVVLACWVNAVLFLQTLFWLSKRRWLRPQYKWGPLSFNKLTHEALRESGDHLLRTATSIVEAHSETSPDDDAGQMKRLQELNSCGLSLAKQIRLYLLVLDWHSHMEDCILFRTVDGFHPLVTKDGYLQHKALHEMEKILQGKCAELLKPADNMLEVLKEVQAILADFIPYSAKHMDWEEDNLNGMLRRALNLRIQKKMLRKIWETYDARSMEEIHKRPTAGNGEWDAYDFSEFSSNIYSAGFPSAEDKNALLVFPPTVPSAPMPIEKQHILRIVLPFVVGWLPYPMQKTRFARAFAWAVPERAQHMGDMIYRGVSDTTWACMVADVPEIIPRGLPGWARRV